MQPLEVSRAPARWKDGEGDGRDTQRKSGLCLVHARWLKAPWSTDPQVCPPQLLSSAYKPYILMHDEVQKIECTYRLASTVINILPILFHPSSDLQ